MKKRLSPNTVIKGLGKTKISEFWSWAYSDLFSNLNRAVLGEFIVAAALGVITILG